MKSKPKRHDEVMELAKKHDMTIHDFLKSKDISPSSFYKGREKTIKKINKLLDEELENQKVEENDNDILSIDLGLPNRKGKYKTLLVLSDLHCGHNQGLTPDHWQRRVSSEDENIITQKACWKWFCEAIESIDDDIDACVVNGDAIDGKAQRNYGTELITTDRFQQIEIAKDCLSVIPTDKFFFTRGTPYHTGSAEQFEDTLAKEMEGIIKDQLNIEIYGKLINFKHKVGGSSIPHGRATQPAKELMWDKLQAIKDDDRHAHVMVRSHRHYYIKFEDSSGVSVVTPALQWNSRYGRQQCSGIIDYGFLLIRVYENGRIEIDPVLASLDEVKKEIITI